MLMDNVRHRKGGTSSTPFELPSFFLSAPRDRWRMAARETREQRGERETGPIETQATTSTSSAINWSRGEAKVCQINGLWHDPAVPFSGDGCVGTRSHVWEINAGRPRSSYDDDRRLDFYADSSDGGRLWYLFHFWHLSHRRAFSFWDHEAPCSNTLCDFRDWGYPEIFPQTENHCGKVPSWPDLAPVPPNIQQQAVMLCSAGDGISSRS